MAACEGLHSIFEKNSSENPTLLEFFSSGNQRKPEKTRNGSPCTDESFSGAHFEEKSVSDTSSGAPASTPLLQFGNQRPALDFSPSPTKACTLPHPTCRGRSHSFSSFHSENLQLCTEGLGFESTYEIEDTTDELNADWKVNPSEEASSRRKLSSAMPLGEGGRRSRSGSVGDFPPPISSIGKPWVGFRSYRHDGRFVLREIRTPRHDFLYASREEGRLKLQVMHPSYDILDEEEDEEGDLRAG